MKLLLLHSGPATSRKPTLSQQKASSRCSTDLGYASCGCRARAIKSRSMPRWPISLWDKWISYHKISPAGCSSHGCTRRQSPQYRTASASSPLREVEASLHVQDTQQPLHSESHPGRSSQAPGCSHSQEASAVAKASPS